MSSREALSVGARLLAILLFVFATSAIASLPATWEAMVANGNVRSPWPFVLGPGVGAVIYLVAGALLWLRYPIAATTGHESTNAGEAYAVALSLLGIYLVATGLPALLGALIEVMLAEQTFLLAGARLVPEVLILGIGVFLVARAKQLSGALAPV